MKTRTCHLNDQKIPHHHQRKMHTGKWQPRHLWRNGGKKKCRSLAPHQELRTGQLGGDGSTRAYPDLWHWRCLRYAIPEQRVLTARRHRRTSKHESWSEGTKRWGWWLIRFSWPSQSKSVRTPSKSSITKGTGSHHQHHCWNSCSRMSRRPHQQAPPQNSQEESMALRVNAIRRYLYRVNSRYQKVALPGGPSWHSLAWSLPWSSWLWWLSGPSWALSSLAWFVPWSSWYWWLALAWLTLLVFGSYTWWLTLGTRWLVKNIKLIYLFCKYGSTVCSYESTMCSRQRKNSWKRLVLMKKQ